MVGPASDRKRNSSLCLRVPFLSLQCVPHWMNYTATEPCQSNGCGNRNSLVWMRLITGGRGHFIPYCIPEPSHLGAVKLHGNSACPWRANGFVMKLIHCASVTLELISGVTLIWLSFSMFCFLPEWFPYSRRLPAEWRAFQLLLMLFLISGNTFVFRHFLWISIF